jgi:hypothetical protein
MSIKRLFINTILSLSLVIFLSACGSSKSTKLEQNSSVDDTAPYALSSPKEGSLTISLNGDQNQSIIVGDTFVDLGAEAIDKVDGNLTSSISIDSNLDSSKEGDYTITYSVTNSKGEKATIKRVVSVKKVASPYDTTPIDSNINLGNETGVLYYADPRPQEHGLNRVLRIDYNSMSYDAIPVNGINPHSIDRAGSTDKFYIRTQNSSSFDVVNFKNESVKTVDLDDHKPRAIGAYNKKYNIQLLSAKDMPVVDVIDVSTDRVIATLGDRNHYNKSDITSNAGSGSATGHSFWLDEDHFGLIDRVHKITRVYKVEKNDDGDLSFKQTSSIEAGTAFHAIERDLHPKTRKDVTTFYAMGEGDLTNNYSPYVLELSFDPQNGKLSRTERVAWLSQSQDTINNIKPTTHHSGVSPDGKYLVVPVLDGKVYFIDRESMDVVKILEAKLGAAHIEFSDSQNVAIITNHFSNELTIIDMESLEIKKTLQIGFNHEFNPSEIHLFQPHFSYVSPDGMYYYTFATQDGDFLKINLKTLEIEDKLYVGGAPEQAHS